MGVAVALGTIVGLVFLPTLACGFVNWDDGHYVTGNPLVLNGLSPAGIYGAFTEIVFSNWAPLTILSYQLDATLWGAAPLGYHLTNICLHALTTGLLYAFLQRATGARGRSIVATLAFGLHPLRVESVAWVAERKDVLSIFFLMLAIVAYERYCRSSDGRWYAATVASFLASLLSKATGVTLPVLLILLDVWPLDRLTWRRVAIRPPHPRSYTETTLRRAVVEKLPLVAISIVFVLATLWTHSTGGALQSENEMPLLAARIPNAIFAFDWYLWKTIWPMNLQPHYIHVGWTLPLHELAAAAAFVIALTAMAIRQSTGRPYVPWGLAWFAIALLPVLGLVQTGFQGYGDRFTYLPHVGLIPMLVWLSADLAGRTRLDPRVLYGWAVVVIVALAAGSLARIPMWRDGLTLWTTVVRQDPGNSIAHFKLANQLVALRRPIEAEPHYRAAIETATPDKPGHVCRMTSLANLACLYHDLGDHERARKLRDLALEIDAADPAVQRMLEHVGR